MFSAIYDIEQSKYSRYGVYLHGQHFWGTVLLAFLLHLGGVALYHLLPSESIQEIPVRVLNVKLGGVTFPEPSQPANSFSAAAAEFAEKIKGAKEIPLEEMEAGQSVSALSAFEKQIDPTTQPKSVRKPAAGNNGQAAAKKDRRAPQEPIMKSEPAKRYYRDPAAESKTSGAAEGQADGNSASASAEVRNRYTQTLSLWIDKHKIYPTEARANGLGGQVLLRIRINRQGRITRYYLEKSSGHDSIDRAISTMVDAANPVPEVPVNYPDPRPYLEFIIPINFKP